MINNVFSKNNLFVLLFSFLYVLLMACSSSPLINPHNYTSDFNIFLVMGEGWKNGAIPLHDLFDNKGPLLSFIYMIGAYIHPGKVGIYVLESLFLFWTIKLLLNIGNQITSSRKISYLALTVVLFIYCYTISCGGTNELFSLPFVLYPIYVIVKYIYRNVKISHWEALGCGLSFAVVSQIRLNNSAIIVGICFALIYYHLRAKRISELLKLMGAFLVGMLIVYIPLALYFASHEALYDMFYASILYNIKYKQSWGGEMTIIRLVSNVARLLSCIILPLVSYYDDKKHRTCALPFCFFISMVTFMTFYAGAGYDHYYTMQLPIVFLCIMLIYRYKRCTQLMVIGIICLPFMPYVYRQIAVNTMFLTNYYKERHSGPYYAMYKDLITDSREVRNIVYRYIPESERNSIYIFQSIAYSSIFIDTPYYPTGKYFALQSNIAHTDSEAEKDIIRSFFKASPKWIVSDIPLSDSKILSRFANQYDIVQSTHINHSQSKLLIYRKHSNASLK